MLIGADHLWQKCLCIENAVFGCNEMIAVPVEILIGMCWFFVHCGDLSVVGTRGNQSVQER